MSSKRTAIKSRMRMEIKEISADGAFEGWLSTYGNVDQGGDVVEPGAFTKTLKDGGFARPLLWQHDPATPVGELMLEDRKDGLWAKGKLLMELPEAQKAYLLIKARIVKGLSMGFESIKDAVEAGKRKLKEVKLYEGSIVTFPMNEMALITNVKARREQKADFNEELNRTQVLAAFYQMHDALYNATTSLVWADLSKDEKVAAAQTVLQQFTDAFLGFWPDYLDVLEEVYGPMEMRSKEAFEKKARELKAGRKISAASAGTIRAACESLLALLEDGAGDDDSKLSTTPESAAAEPDETQGEPANAGKSEPDNHSAAELSTAFRELRALIPAA